MSRFCLSFSVLMITLLSLSAHAQGEQVGTSHITIITPMPAPKEVVVEPEGYVSCTTVEAGWYENQWHPEHRVCLYNPGTNTVIKDEAWVSGYWVCNQYKTLESTQGDCTAWEWRPGHWSKSTERY